MKGLTLIVTALFLVSTAVPVLAQTGGTSTPAKATDVKTDAKSTGKAKDAEEVKDEKADKKAEKDTKKADKEDNERSNKGGKVRGLDRADEVAGDHGQKGRDTARGKQGR